MSHVLRCPNPSCGTERDSTELGRVRGSVLILPPNADVQPDGSERWRIVCPVCGEVRAWRGEVAVRLRQAA